MSRRPRIAASVAFFAVMMTLSACTGDNGHEERASPGDSATASAPSTDGPLRVEHLVPPGDVTVLKTLDNQTGAASLGAFPVRKKFAFIYLTCSGPGVIKIDVDPLGSYPLVCDEIGSGSLNQFQVDDQKSYTVKVQAAPGQTWALTVAESDTDT